jgi:hypothetical protein
MHAIEKTAERLKKEIDRILIDAVSGHDESLLYQGRFIRWGAVGIKIHEKIDEAFRSIRA